jgi:hypothetical protein
MSNFYGLTFLPPCIYIQKEGLSDETEAVVQGKQVDSSL